MKPNEDEGLEEYLQRVLTSTMDGFNTADNNTVQQLATEAFLRGCKHKEASYVFNLSPRTIQKTCQKVKTVLANRKAIFWSKVSFQEKPLHSKKSVRFLKLKTNTNFDRGIQTVIHSPFRDKDKIMVTLVRNHPLLTHMVPGIPSRDPGLLPIEEAGLLEITGRTGIEMMSIDVAVFPTIRQRDKPQQSSPLPAPRENDGFPYKQSPVRGNEVCHLITKKQTRTS